MNSIAEEMIAFLKKTLPHARVRHSIGSWKQALELASLYGVPAEKVTPAALLHDAAKAMSTPDLIRCVMKNGIAVPHREEVIENHPSLLHGFVSARIARTKFGIRDRDVLGAIALHTTAGPRMSTLAKIIYLADLTAPDRKFREARALRRLCRRDLDAAMLEALTVKITFVLSKKEWLHPTTIGAWNDFIKA